MKMKIKLFFVISILSLIVSFFGCAPIMNNVLKPNEKELEQELPNGVSAVDQGLIGSIYWCYGSDKGLYFFGKGDFDSSESPWSKYEVKTITFGDNIEFVGVINGVTNLDKVTFGRHNKISSDFFEDKVINDFETKNSNYHYNYPLLITYYQPTCVYCDRNFKADLFTVSSDVAAHAFKDCTKIKVIYISEDVDRIENNAFENFTKEQSIYIDYINKPTAWDSLWNNACYANIQWNCTPYGARPPLNTEYKYQEGTYSETIKFFEDNTYEYRLNDTDSENKYLCNLRIGEYKTTQYGYKLVSLKSVKNDYGIKGWTENYTPNAIRIQQPVYKNGDYVYIDGFEIREKYDSQGLNNSIFGEYYASYSYCVTDTESHDVVGVGVKSITLKLSKVRDNSFSLYPEYGTTQEDYSLKFEYKNELYDLYDESKTFKGSFRDTNDLFFITMDGTTSSNAEPYYESKGVLINGKSTYYLENTQVENPTAYVDFLHISDSSILIKAENIKTITATPYPLALNPTPKVTFSSSDESIATVTANGVITGVSKGNATITATCEDFTRTCSVEVY